MKWNLRMIAAQRDIWKASELKRLLADAGLVISAGKMSGLWSGQPVSIRLDDLDVICAVLNCTPADLLVPEPEKAAERRAQADGVAAAPAAGGDRPQPIVRRHLGRSTPPR
ncbi:helix-turn-helix domain-containing protein [Streptodolium elevatio]